MLRIIFPTILLWIGLPLTLLIIFTLLQHSITADKPLLLFVMYTAFSWSIALMIFIMESTRQKLFHQANPTRSALRLGLYGCVAIILALIASPEPEMLVTTEKLIVIILVFVYGAIMGYTYQRISNSNKGRL